MKHLHFLMAGCLLIFCCSCRSQDKYQFDEGDIFHTSYHISYASHKDLHKAIRKCLQEFNASLSMFQPESTISRINRAKADEPVDISDDSWAVTVIERSVEISQISDGAFDITVAPLVNLWGFGLKNKANVSAAQIDSIKPFVGYRKISCQDGIFRKSDSRLQLDASAIAKGYACDVVAELFQKHGVRNYLIEIGGEIRMAGLNAKNKKWTVGIDMPQDDSLAINRQLQTAIRISDKGMATSGNYRNFYMKDGRKIAHTIDPLTGYPVQHSLLSATVLSEDCLTADAFATAFMVMGLEKAIRLTDSLSYIAAYFIYSDDTGNIKTWHSQDLDSCIVEIR